MRAFIQFFVLLIRVTIGAAEITDPEVNPTKATLLLLTVTVVGDVISDINGVSALGPDHFASAGKYIVLADIREVRYLLRMGDSWQFTTRFVSDDTLRTYVSYAMRRNDQGIVFTSVKGLSSFVQLIPYVEDCNVTVVCPATTPVASIPISSPPLIYAAPVGPVAAPIAETALLVNVWSTQLC